MTFEKNKKQKNFWGAVPGQHWAFLLSVAEVVSLSLLPHRWLGGEARGGQAGGHSSFFSVPPWKLAVRIVFRVDVAVLVTWTHQDEAAHVGGCLSELVVLTF